MRVLVTALQKVERVAFDPEGAHLFASGSHSGSLGYGDPDTGIDVFDLGGSGTEPVSHLFGGRDVGWFDPLADGRLAALSNGDVSVRDRSAEREVWLVAGEWRVWGPCGVAAGGRLVSALGGKSGRDCRRVSAREAGLGCWALAEGGVPPLAWQLGLGHDRAVRALTIAPDGRSFWTAEHVVSQIVPYTRLEFVKRDADTGKPLREPVAYPNKKIAGLAVSDKFLVAHDGPTLFVYDLAHLDRKPKKVANPVKRKHVAGFALHPSGKWLAAAGLDGAVTLWETTAWTVARSWAWDAGQARSVCFGADGTLAAAGTDSGKIVVWDLDL